MPRRHEHNALGGITGHSDPSEFVPGFEASAGSGSAPRNTPAEVVDRLDKEINAGVADPKIEARFADSAEPR